MGGKGEGIGKGIKGDARGARRSGMEVEFRSPPPQPYFDHCLTRPC